MNLTQTSMSGMVIKGMQGSSHSAETRRPAQLNPGDVVNGRVLASENGRAAVRLADGSVLTAELQEGVQLKSGEMIRLQVTEQADGKVFMRLSRLSGGEAAQAAALMEAGAEYTPARSLSGDTRGVQIAELLRQYGVSPSREGVARTVGLMEAYPQLDVRTAAFLAANGKQAEKGVSNPRLDALVDVLVEARDAGPSANRPINALLNALESNPQLLERPAINLPLGGATFLPPQTGASEGQTAPQVIFTEAGPLPQAGESQPQASANQPQPTGNTPQSMGTQPQGLPPQNSGGIPQTNQPQVNVQPSAPPTQAPQNIPQSIPQNIQNEPQLTRDIPQPAQNSPQIAGSIQQNVQNASPLPQDASNNVTQNNMQDALQNALVREGAGQLPAGNFENASVIGRERIPGQQAQVEMQQPTVNAGQGGGNAEYTQGVPNRVPQGVIPQQVPENAVRNPQAELFRAAPQTLLTQADQPLDVSQNMRNNPLPVPNLSQPSQNAQQNPINPQFIQADSQAAQQPQQPLQQLPQLPPQPQQSPSGVPVNLANNQQPVLFGSLEGGQLPQNPAILQELPAVVQEFSAISRDASAQASPQIQATVSQPPQTAPVLPQPQLPQPLQTMEQVIAQAPQQLVGQSAQVASQAQQPSLPSQAQVTPQIPLSNPLNLQGVVENPPPQIALMPNEVLAENPAQDGNGLRNASPSLPSETALPPESAPNINRQTANETVAAQNQTATQQTPAEPLPAAVREAVSALTRFLAQADPQTARLLVAENAMPQAARVLQTAANLPPEQARNLIQTFAREMNLPPRAEEAFMRAADAFRQVIDRPLPENSSSIRLFASAVPARLSQEAPAAELNRAVTSLITNLSTIRAAAANAPEAAYLAAQAEARADAVPSLTQFTYIQIPITMYERREVADLYVMKRKHEGGAEKDEFTIAIALETEHLGRVEAIVRARDRDVGITFRMDEGDAADQVRQGFGDLEETVRDAGYNLRSAIMSRLDRPITPQTFAQSAAEEESRHYALNLLV